MGKLFLLSKFKKHVCTQTFILTFYTKNLFSYRAPYCNSKKSYFKEMLEIKKDVLFALVGKLVAITNTYNFCQQAQKKGKKN